MCVKSKWYKHSVCLFVYLFIYLFVLQILRGMLSLGIKLKSEIISS